MKHQIEVGQSVAIKVESAHHYSKNTLVVNKYEVYEFHCDPTQKWKDWFIKSNANGFWNPLANVIGLRLPGVKCFTLCGCYNQNETKLFRIGLDFVGSMMENGDVSFFANDSFNYYKNNFGSMDLNIRRTK